MDKVTIEIDTSDTPHCPNRGCPYILFLANGDDDGDWYCMECSEAFYEDEVDD
jgi:hypothetical protein